MTDKEYFADHTRESNSTLGWLNVSPMYYARQMEIAKSEDESDEPEYYKFGHAVHAYLLEREDFNNRYVVSSARPPSNAIQRRFCDFLIATVSITDKTLLMAYKMSYAVKESDKGDKLLDKAKILYERNKNYIDFSRKRGDKKVLLEKDYKSILKIHEYINSVKELRDAIYMVKKGCEAYNEKVIFYTFKGVKMKSKLDRLVIDFNKKTITLYDVKTSSVKHEGTDFKESFNRSFKLYKYNRQFGLYSYAVKEFFTENFKEYDISDFKFEAYVIAIKSNFDNEVRYFKVDDNKMLEGLKSASLLIEDLKYYRKNGFTRRKNIIEDLS